MSEATAKKEHVHFVADRVDIDYIDTIHKGHGGRSTAMRIALKRYIDYLNTDQAKEFKAAITELG